MTTAILPTTSQNQEEIKVLQKIEDLLDKSDVDTQFTAEEQKVIRQMIIVYQTLMSFGRVGIWIKNLIIGAAAFIAAWVVVYSWMLGNLKSLLGIE